MDMFDVSPLVPEARVAALAASQVYWQHTRSWFVGLVVHGSALKGGFIPHCSDIDFQLYLEDAAFSDNGELPLELTLAMQRDLARIELQPFGYIQTYAYPPHMQKHNKKAFVGPVAGAYHVVYGRLPIAEATEEQVLWQARRTLEEAPGIIARAAADMLGSGGTRLHRAVRLLCASVWPVLYSLLTVREPSRPCEVWRLPKDVVVNMLLEDEAAGRAIRQFYRLACDYYNSAQSLEMALTLFEQGAIFLRAVMNMHQGG